jgi:hypothetical protein
MNPLTEFWSDYKDTFPVLALVARFVLSVPASSAKSESVFSDAGNTLSSKRSRLDPSNVNKLMVIKSNIDIYRKNNAC